MESEEMKAARHIVQGQFMNEMIFRAIDSRKRNRRNTDTRTLSQAFEEGWNSNGNGEKIKQYWEEGNKNRKELVNAILNYQPEGIIDTIVMKPIQWLFKFIAGFIIFFNKYIIGKQDI